ncbi:MAG: universal stress protein [Chloroflexi bacterium]|nr:universal stress protein [Chloroflexota bacterium]
MDSPSRYSSAVMDFRRARRRAARQEFFSRFTGRSSRLVPFEEIRQRIGAENFFPRRLEDIPLDAIIGSVGRYEDFNRQFLPRLEAQQSRWARVRLAIEERGLPPIEVYKLGEVYFVMDGHHRVSVARQVESKMIEAYVTEIPTKVTLSPEDDADEIILKAEHAGFLTDTHLDESHPDIELRLTLPGRYRDLREHIAVHRYYLSQEQDRAVNESEAARSWVDNVYLPAVESIRRRGLLRDFPNRTETDLYLWLMTHRTQLTESLGWELETDEAAAHLGQRFGLRPGRILKRFGLFLKDVLTPDSLESGTASGEWRAERTNPERLFGRVLVALSDDPENWQALDQALILASLESSTLRGLHVIPKRTNVDEATGNRIEREFFKRVEYSGVPGRVVFEHGQVAREVELRARWSDLVVLHLKHPPGEAPLERLRSGIRILIQRSSRPILIVPHVTKLTHALLAFDGSRKSVEALFVAAHVAQRWGARLTVLTTQEHEEKTEKIQLDARKYLANYGVVADFIQGSGSAGEAVISTVKERGCDIILMGGYGASPLVEVVLGSTVDHVLRAAVVPVLICR